MDVCSVPRINLSAIGIVWGFKKKKSFITQKETRGKNAFWFRKLERTGVQTWEGGGEELGWGFSGKAAEVRHNVS